VELPAIIALGVIGLILCLFWYSRLNLYRRQATAKFTVIGEVENDLPYPAFTQEWAESQRRRPARIIFQDSIAPITLAVMYVILVSAYVALMVIGR
jgi:hypothetical protein